MSLAGRPGRWLTTALLLAAAASLLTVTYRASLAHALHNLERQTERTAALFSANIESTVNRYSYLPRVLAARPSVVLAARLSDARAADALSAEFAIANAEAGTLNVYAMDRDGLTFASSNHAEQNSFVGKNFGFRPYFRYAMQGQSGRYFALGTTSGKRGYYFSSPIVDVDSGQILGAVVVKVGLDQLEANWRDKDPIALLTDQHGVVFSGSRPDWIFNSLFPLTPMAREELRDSKQFVGEPLDAIARLERKALGPFALFEHRGAPGHAEYLHHNQHIADSGWWLHLLSDIAPARAAARRDTASVAILLALVSALTLVFRQRARTWRLLQQAKLSLEEKVQARTADLSSLNRRLQQEAEARQAAYQELESAQEKLLHSNRLAAIGELSTAITHELNQPITAISAYASNSQAFLQQGQHDRAASNNAAILDLTKRMSEITHILRNHARKGEAGAQAVCLREAVDNACAIVKPKIDAGEVQLRLQLDAPAELHTQQIRLEQILVNLLINACDAVADSPRREITVFSQQRETAVEITICDSGEGIPEDKLDKLFEPFFTTKGHSQGLGLGLSISQSIAKGLNGSLTAQNNDAGGACFRLSLPGSMPDG